MQRRDFITLVGGAAVTWPLAARAQQPKRMRRVGVLMPLSKSDPEAKRPSDSLTQGLQKLGWFEEKNISFEMRYSEGKPERLPALAAELVQADIDVLSVWAAQAVEAARKATSTIPIVMTGVGDALGGGYIAIVWRTLVAILPDLLLLQLTRAPSGCS
jgi:putative tryptophan/tyrosine transport system substrate-binding protein